MVATELTLEGTEATRGILICFPAEYPWDICWDIPRVSQQPWDADGLSYIHVREAQP